MFKKYTLSLFITLILISLNSTAKNRGVSIQELAKLDKPELRKQNFNENDINFINTVAPFHDPNLGPAEYYLDNCFIHFCGS